MASQLRSTASRSRRCGRSGWSRTAGGHRIRWGAITSSWCWPTAATSSSSAASSAGAGTGNGVEQMTAFSRLARRTSARRGAPDPDPCERGLACSFGGGISTGGARVSRRVHPASGRELSRRRDRREAPPHGGPSPRCISRCSGRASRRHARSTAAGLVSRGRSLSASLLVCKRGPRLPRDLDRPGACCLSTSQRVRARALPSSRLSDGSWNRPSRRSSTDFLGVP
jgi:hypothetical protein